MSGRAPTLSRDARLQSSIGLLSAAITAHQLVLMQVLGYVHWHHFAYMVVAVALLGFGAAGTVLTFWRLPLVARAGQMLPWLALVCGVAMPLGLRLSQVPALAFDLHVLFVDSRQWLSLATIYLCLLPPFFLGGLATSLILTARAKRAGRYYFASLIGAGAGGVFGVALLEAVSPARAPALVAMLALASSVGFAFELSSRRRRALVATATLALLVTTPAIPLRPSQFKSIAFALNLPDARVIEAAPSARGWVQIVGAPALRPAPPLSLNFPGALPNQHGVFINGYAHGGILDAVAAEDPTWMEFTPEAIGYVATPRERVALLETGPGGAAAYARARGARRIVVVEPNRTLVQLLRRQTDDGVWAPEWHWPEVDVQGQSGRQFLRRTAEQFDLIVFPPAGVAGGAGITSTTEQFLLTQEAFRDAWNRLAAGGALLVSAPLEFPVRHPLRLLTTIVAAVESLGVSDLGRHVLALRSWSSVAFLVTRDPAPDAMVAAVREFCDERSFDPLLLPDLRPEERTAYNEWPDPEFFADLDQIMSGRGLELQRRYPFRLEPTSDDRPWFGQFLRWNALRDLRTTFGSERVPFFELGTLMVALTFVQLLGLATICILLPLWRLRPPHTAPKPQRTRLGTVLYFSGLGAGFMLIEIALMIRFHGWLGSPLLAAGAVLTALLVFAGMGSWISERFDALPTARMRVTAVCMVMIAVTGWATARLAPTVASWPLLLQLSAAAGLVAPLGVVLGMAFPLGLRELQARAPNQVPWAWGINGCVSVATPAGAMLLGLEAGVSAMFAAAALAYGLALLAAWGAQRLEARRAAGDAGAA
jgi:hypothetical protein